MSNCLQIAASCKHWQMWSKKKKEPDELLGRTKLQQPQLIVKAEAKV